MMCFVYYKNKQKSPLKITNISNLIKKNTQAFSEDSNDKRGYSVHFNSVC